MGVKDLLSGLLKPASKAFQARTERKQKQDELGAKVTLAKQNGETEITMKVADIDKARVADQKGSWKDEYITVSIMTVFNIIVIGALAQAFGFPNLLEGIVIAVKTLNEVGVNVGQLIYLTVIAGLGLTVWNRI